MISNCRVLEKISCGDIEFDVYITNNDYYLEVETVGKFTGKTPLCVKAFVVSQMDDKVPEPPLLIYADSYPVSGDDSTPVKRVTLTTLGTSIGFLLTEVEFGNTLAFRALGSLTVAALKYCFGSEDKRKDDK